MQHAKLSPSSSARWLTCPGSVTLIEKLSELLGTTDVASDPALKGTQMHAIGESMLLDKVLEPHDMFWVDAKGDNQVITWDDVNECVTPYIEFADSLSGDRFVELKVHITDEVWGTGDLVVFQDGILTICDLKTGHGIVYAKDNTQLKLYALGALNSDEAMMYGDIDVINTVISQGRIGHHDSYAYSLEELLEFEEEVNQAIDRINTEPDNYVPSPKASVWCPARAHCPAIAKQVKEAAQDDFRQMTLDALGDALDQVPMMKAWIKGVEDQVKEHLEKGDHIEGYKMVTGRKSRNWASVESAEKYFRNRVNRFLHNCYEQKFLSPAKMEKMLKREDVKVRGKVDFDKVVVHGFSAPTVVDESDLREALVYGDKAKSDFEDCDEDLFE